jgi:hypothetical protein
MPREAEFNGIEMTVGEKKKGKYPVRAIPIMQADRPYPLTNNERQLGV